MALLAPGDMAPDFTLTAANGSLTALKDFRGRKVIVYFYPAAMTPGCTVQAGDFSQHSQKELADYQIIGISRDNPAKLTEFAKQEELNFILLSDPDLQTHKAFGAWGEKMNYGKKITGVIRSTFVIDPEGRIELARYNVKATGHVNSLLKQLG